MSINGPWPMVDDTFQITFSSGVRLLSTPRGGSKARTFLPTFFISMASLSALPLRAQLYITGRACVTNAID